MCKCLGKYLCCCLYRYTNQSVNERERDKSKDEKQLETKSDSEGVIRSSSENRFAHFDSKSLGKKLRSLPPIDIRFQSSKDAKDDSLPSHRIRLMERGFELQSETPIGEGVFSKVYSVLRSKDKSLMACKISVNKELAESSSLSRQFCKEVQFVNTFIESQHLVRYFGQFIYDAKYSYIIMEYSTGQNLHSRLATSRQPFTETEAQFYFAPIARALNEMHTNRIAHRNLKLDNVFVFKGPNNREILKLTDYCTNRVSLKDKKVMIHVRDAKSVTYMSPQILKFYAKHLHKTYRKYDRKIKPFDPMAGDIWALGVCLYYMLMKTAPYGLPPKLSNLDSNKAVRERFTFISECLIKFKKGLFLSKEVNSRLSKVCVALLQDLLEPKADRRIDHFGVVQHIWVRSIPEESKN